MRTLSPSSVVEHVKFPDSPAVRVCPHHSIGVGVGPPANLRCPCAFTSVGNKRASHRLRHESDPLVEVVSEEETDVRRVRVSSERIPEVSKD